MARVSVALRDWLARVEILARGAEQHRAAAVRALGSDRPAQARQHALAILDELPKSRIALALWADAAEAMLLDEEAREALERLVLRVPFRADVWYRLARVRHRLGVAGVGEALQRAVEAEQPQEAADAALLWLAERDLAAGDPTRAERWLARMSLGGRNGPDARRCLAEARLDLDDWEGAIDAAQGVDAPPVADGRGWLVQGRLLLRRDLPGAVAAFERALLLRAPGVDRIVCSLIEQSTPQLAQRVRPLVESLGYGDRPRWRAAFAASDGRLGDAVAALAVGAREDADLVRAYARAAVEARQPDALLDATAIAIASGVSLEASITALAEAVGANEIPARLAALDEAIAAETAGWASVLRQKAYATWFPADDLANWSAVLAELDDMARELGVPEVIGQISGLARELQRPLRVAVVGEFNAGKSSFINALLGEEVAPVGVLPTTATVNHLCWAPDRFARVVLNEGEPQRVVAHGDLRETLAEVGAHRVQEVVIYAPLEPLRQIELIDTPGFNAPDAEHAASTRNALADAHVALWLLDGTQALKDTERVVLTEIARSGVPLIVLVNKADRLGNEDSRSQVLRRVSESLREFAVRVEAEPIAFSARWAITGRTTAVGGRDASWSAVEDLVERSLVARSGVLRERALRRRALRVAEDLGRVVRGVEARREMELRSFAVARREAWATVAGVRAARRELEAVLESAALSGMEELARAAQPVLGAAGEGDRFVALRAREAVGDRVANAALEFLHQRWGELADDLADQYRRAVALTAQVAAPWLLNDAVTQSPIGNQERSTREALRPGMPVVQRLVRAASDELAATTEAAARSMEEPCPDRVGIRVGDLVRTLTATLES